MFVGPITFNSIAIMFFFSEFQLNIQTIGLEFVAHSVLTTTSFDEFFEDDVMLAPAVPPRLVLRLLSCGAALSLKSALPVFYAGACLYNEATVDANDP